MENNPRVVFERLFGDGTSARDRARQLQENSSILDAVTREVAGFQKRLGAGDRTRVNEYLDAIREIERASRRPKRRACSNSRLPERPVGMPESFEDHCRLMFDLQALAYQADITRVITFMLSRELSQRTYPEIGVPDPHHGVSHHQDDPEKLAKLTRINTYHTGLFAYYLEKLSSTPDGDGSLLDHAMILYGGGLSDGNLHTHSPLPLLLAGGAAGRLKGNRHVQCPTDTPLANLLVTVLEKMDVPAERIGDSTGRLDL